MTEQQHISSCCKAAIIVKGEGKGLYCSKCKSETFRTIIIVDKEFKRSAI